MTQDIRIVTDSAADLSAEIVSKYGILVVPLTIRFGDDEFLDGLELCNREFWQKMAASPALPSTAAPSPGAFEKAFRDAVASGAKAVVCVSLSSALSATYQSATQAARAIGDEFEVHVIDSRSCALAEGALVIEAAERAAAGASTAEIIAAIDELQGRSHLFAALDTLENLKKGGRIGAAGAFFGSLLSVKPIVTLKDGKVEAESRQRTRGRALEYLAKLVAGRTPVDHVHVGHSGAPDIERFLELLAPTVPLNQIDLWQIGPVVGTHTGPGLIAVSFASSGPN